MSLRLRLVLAGAMAIVFALGLATFGLSALFHAHVERRAMSELSAQIDQILAALDQSEQNLIMTNNPADPRFDRVYSGLYWQINTPEQVLRSRSLWDFSLDLQTPIPMDGSAYPHNIAGPQGQELLALARSVSLPTRLGGQQILAIVASDRSEMLAARKAFIADLTPYLLLLAFTLIAAGWVQVTIGLKPLSHLSRRVAALHASPTQRMGQDWPSEVRVLAAEVDMLLDAKAVDLNRAQMSAADLAHGLKTPLQALMGEAERMRKSGAETEAAGIVNIAQSMRGTVDRQLARTRRQSRVIVGNCDLKQATEAVMSVIHKMPDGARLNWIETIPAGLSVAIEKGDLTEALGTVIENAARHAKSCVRLNAYRDQNKIIMTITDDGKGIAPEIRDAMLSRFTRADEGGTGLGLAIANEIISEVGGRLALADTAPGLEVRLTLPASTPQSI